MVDFGDIPTLIAALKGVVGLSKELKAFPLEEAASKKAAEVDAQIFAVYESALASQYLQSKMNKRNQELEEEVTRLKNWDVQKEDYELKALGNSAFVYSLKEHARSAEPVHWLCPPCYENSKKSILQRGAIFRGDYPWRCPVCKAEIQVSRNISPSS